MTRKRSPKATEPPAPIDAVAEEPLRILALALHFGADEHQRAVTLLVHWRGEPFAAARAALDSFLAACRAALAPPVPSRAACCAELLVAMPHALACPTCGEKLVVWRRKVSLDEYLDGLLTMDVDSVLSDDRLYPHRNPPKAVQCGRNVLGQWEFFGGFPEDCDVVEVSGFDLPFASIGAGEASYRVLHVGKAATGASARGTIPVQNPSG